MSTVLILIAITALLAALAWVRRAPTELDRRLSAVDVALDARPIAPQTTERPATPWSA